MILPSSIRCQARTRHEAHALFHHRLHFRWSVAYPRTHPHTIHPPRYPCVTTIHFSVSQFSRSPCGYFFFIASYYYHYYYCYYYYFDPSEEKFQTVSDPHATKEPRICGLQFYFLCLFLLCFHAPSIACIAAVVAGLHFQYEIIFSRTR